MSRPTSRQCVRGFSLAELLVVVAIAAMLVAFAVPAYQNYTYGARRSDARAMLLDAANRQARFFADNSSYTDSLTALGYASDPAESTDGYYQLTAALTANGYTLSAAPVANQVADTDCGTFTYNSLGARGASGPGQCWP